MDAKDFEVVRKKLGIMNVCEHQVLIHNKLNNPSREEFINELKKTCNVYLPGHRGIVGLIGHNCCKNSNNEHN